MPPAFFIAIATFRHLFDSCLIAAFAAAQAAYAKPQLIDSLCTSSRPENHARLNPVQAFDTCLASSFSHPLLVAALAPLPALPCTLAAGCTVVGPNRLTKNDRHQSLLRRHHPHYGVRLGGYSFASRDCVSYSLRFGLLGLSGCRRNLLSFQQGKDEKENTPKYTTPTYYPPPNTGAFLLSFLHFHFRTTRAYGCCCVF